MADIIGTLLDEVLAGTADADKIVGDIDGDLTGNAKGGKDTIDGGAGNDTISGDASGDIPDNARGGDDD